MDNKLLFKLIVTCCVVGHVAALPTPRDSSSASEDTIWKQREAARISSRGFEIGQADEEAAGATTAAPEAAAEPVTSLADQIGMDKYAFDRSDYASFDDTQNILERSRLEALIPNMNPGERLEDDEVRECIKLYNELTAEIVESESDDDLIEDQQASNEDDPDGLNECIICCAQMIKARTTTLGRCGHKFHSTCLNKWMKYKNGPGEAQSKCPLCRQNIKD